MRRALLIVATALLLALDVSIAPLALAVILSEGGSGHGPVVVTGSLFFLLVVAVLVWLTAAVLTQLRKPTA